MRLIHLTDSHISETIGRRRFGYEPILNKWKWCAKFAQASGCQYIVHTGDVFHKPLVPRVVEQKVASLIAQTYLETGIQHIFVAGNHDIGSGVQTVDGKSIQTILLTSGVIVPEALIAVINNNEDLVQSLDSTNRVVTACHHMITPEPVMFDHHILYDLQVSDAVKVVLCGDFHEGWPEPIEHNGVWWSNPGALARISRDRPVRCALVDTDAGVEYVSIPDELVLPWDEVYDGESLENEKKLSLVRQSLTGAIKRVNERGVVGYDERLKAIDGSFVKLEGSLVQKGVNKLIELCNKLETE